MLRVISGRAVGHFGTVSCLCLGPSSWAFPRAQGLVSAFEGSFSLVLMLESKSDIFARKIIVSAPITNEHQQKLRK